LWGSGRVQPIAAERFTQSAAWVTGSAATPGGAESPSSAHLRHALVSGDIENWTRGDTKTEPPGSPEDAAALVAQHALVLNVPLNHDLNHRFFEVMAAGVPQVVFGGPMCSGPAASSSSRSWCCSSWLSPSANRNRGPSHPFGLHQLAVPRGPVPFTDRCAGGWRAGGVFQAPDVAWRRRPVRGSREQAYCTWISWVAHGRGRW